jgi:hypothetical protein
MVPLRATYRDRAGFAVTEEHQGWKIDGAGRAAIHKDDAPIPNDLDAVVVGIIVGVHHHVGGVGKVKDAVGAGPTELEHDGGGRVEGEKALRQPTVDGAAVDPRGDASYIAHEVASERKEVVTMVEDQGATTTILASESPTPGAKGNLPGRIAPASADVETKHLRLAYLAGLKHLFGAHMGRIEDEILINAEDDTGLIGSPDHVVGLHHSGRHRLLNGHVLAGLAGSDSHRGM